MDHRKELILEAIIRYFIETANPVGSKLLKEDFNLSSATIRNDMAALENKGLVYQPYTSAGRVPTEVGYRFYVDKLIKSPKKSKDLEEHFERVRREYYKKKTSERVYDTVAILSQMTDDVAFATIPENKKTFYLGLANILRKPEFIANVTSASEVIEVLEGGFFSVLEELEIDEKIRIFIGKENMIPKIQTCSMLATKYQNNGFSGVIGVLRPMRMNYSFNKTVLELAVQILNEG